MGIAQDDSDFKIVDMFVGDCSDTVRIERVQPRRGALAATIDMLPAASRLRPKE